MKITIILVLFIREHLNQPNKLIIDKVLINLWITINYDELRKICKSVSRLEDYDDLFQICIEQFILNKKIPDMPDKERLYFFTRLVRNQYYSKTSRYYNHYKKFKTDEVYDYDFPDLQYQEPDINLDWVKKQLTQMKQSNDWYYGRLFELYISEGCNITATSKLTTIPINTVSRDINKVRKELNKRKNKLL